MHKIDFKKSLFLVILVLSFLSTISFRVTHYQELDSRVSYNLLKDDQNLVAKFISGIFFEKDNINSSRSYSKFNLKYIIKKTPDWILIRLKGKSFYENALLVYNKDRPNPKTAKEIRDFIDRVFTIRPHIENISSQGIYKILLSELFNYININPMVRKVLNYPLASTYSIGSGIIYSLIYVNSNNYYTFLSISTFLTQLLAHLSILFLFFTLLNLGIPVFYSSLASLFTLFSISLYSYGFHLGSTVYSYFTFSLFFWCATVFNNKHYFKKLGILAACLVYLNTLMAIPLAGLLLVNLKVKIKSNKNGFLNLLSNIKTVIKEQKIGIILFIIFLILFFQTGHGIRGRLVEYSNIPYYAYYSMLNLTVWFNDYGEFINTFQISFFLIITIIGFYVVNKESDFIKSSKNNIFFKLINASLIVYLILLIVGSLNLAPSRHILFLKIFITYYYGFGTYYLFKKYTSFNKKLLKLSIIFLIGILGLFSHQIRFFQMADPLQSFIIPDDVDLVISPISDGLKNTIDIPVINARDLNFEDSTDVKILYLSQVTNFEEWLISSKLNDKEKNSIVNLKMISNISDKNTFMPYIPSHLAHKFSYNRGNGLYGYTFNIQTTNKNK
jgi:hypothetical protein